MECKKVAVYAALSVMLSTPVWAAEQGASQSQSGAMQTQSAAQQASAEEQNPLMKMQVKQIKGKSVVNAKGEEMGDVDKIVQNRTNNSIDAVVSVGGFLGIGAKKIAIPIDQLKLQDNKLAWSESVTKDQLKKQPEYQASQYNDIADNKVLADVTGTASEAKKQVSFQDLDTNHDGYISPQEAKSDPQLSKQFSQADKNSDDRIDQSEFSAFEEASPQSTPKQQEDQSQSPQSD